MKIIVGDTGVEPVLLAAQWAVTSLYDPAFVFNLGHSLSVYHFANPRYLKELFNKGSSFILSLLPVFCDRLGRLVI